jgi:hypothetical protein
VPPVAQLTDSRDADDVLSVPRSCIDCGVSHMSIGVSRASANLHPKCPICLRAIFDTGPALACLDPSVTGATHDHGDGTNYPLAGACWLTRTHLSLGSDIPESPSGQQESSGAARRIDFPQPSSAPTMESSQ